jgi:hypothetical protein
MHPYVRYAEVLEDYTDWLMHLQLDGVRTVDFNTPLTTYLRTKRAHNKTFRFSGDGIHPSNMGHLLMAQVFLQGMGTRIQFDELETEYQTVHNDPLFKLVDQRRRLRSKGWLEYVGYTRGKTVKRDSIQDIQTQAAAFQEQIDALKNG